jgi:hypothetical protein
MKTAIVVKKNQFLLDLGVFKKNVSLSFYYLE